MPSTTTTPKLVIFTDLDGTLLDKETYSFEPARPALQMIKEKGIPLVLSSSKTRTEIELYRKELENAHPFVSENGGAVFVPKGYLSFSFPYDRVLGEYFVLELGTFYPIILEILDSIKKETGIPIKGFSDLTEEELSSISGLSLEEAEFAKKREYDEPFIIEGGEREIETVRRKIEGKGMNYVWGGKFHHILGKNDKGKAVEILKELYENEFFSISTVGIGDSLNDIPMLLAVDHPIFLKEKEGISPEIPSKNLLCFEGTGPQAWNEAILNILSELQF
ncbi:MAG: mannosyl-3-phosphoglycerate phosphatase [Thermodesulfobacteriota bacterium]|nr:mannosyl-3-phosphoglycerate phosphatase [Thermodesulfobacteriota bacterium]